MGLPEQTSAKLTGVKLTFGVTTICVVLGLKHEPVPLGVNVTVNVPGPEAVILNTLPVKKGLPDQMPLIPPCWLLKTADASPEQVVATGEFSGTSPEEVILTLTVAWATQTPPVGANVIGYVPIFKPAGLN